MEVFKNIKAIDVIQNSDSQSHSITIGNFDGCHLGHQKLIKKTLELAKNNDTISLALTFDPHPKYFFNPQKKPEYLFTIDQKIRAFEALGIERFVLQEFDHAFSTTTAHDFYQEYLKRELKAAHIIIGTNFYFGQGREGNPKILCNLAKTDDIKVFTEDPILFDGEPISSSRIRKLLVENGDVETVCQMLGRPYGIEGKLIQGNQLGRKLGFPTMNLGQIKQVQPKPGVYVGFVWIAKTEKEDTAPLVTVPTEQLYPAIFNFGYRPTVSAANEENRSAEAHLLKFFYSENDVFYGKNAAFYLTHRLREEMKFSSFEHLKVQIAKDIILAEQCLKLRSF